MLNFTILGYDSDEETAAPRKKSEKLTSEQSSIPERKSDSDLKTSRKAANNASRESGKVTTLESRGTQNGVTNRSTAYYRVILPPVIAQPWSILPEMPLSSSTDSLFESMTVDNNLAPAGPSSNNLQEGDVLVPGAVSQQSSKMTDFANVPEPSIMVPPLIAINDAIISSPGPSTRPAADSKMGLSQHTLVHQTTSGNAAHTISERPARLAASVLHALGRQSSISLNSNTAVSKKRALSEADHDTEQVAGPSNDPNGHRSKRNRNSSKNYRQPDDTLLTSKILMELENKAKSGISSTRVNNVTGELDFYFKTHMLYLHLETDQIYSSSAFFRLQATLDGRDGLTSNAEFWTTNDISNGNAAQSSGPPEGMNLHGMCVHISGSVINCFQRYPALPKMFQNLDSEVINAERILVQNALFAMAVHRTEMDEDTMLSSVAALHDGVDRAPLSPHTLPSIQKSWGAISCLTVDLQCQSIWMRNVASCIMTTHCIAWRWLTVTIPNAVSNIIHHPNDLHSIWLWDLVKEIRESVISRRHNVYFDPEDYGVELQSQRRIAAINFRTYIAFREEDVKAWTKSIVPAVQEILKVWLEYPLDKPSHWKALYALNIVETLGPEFLYLDCVWRTYNTATSKLVQSCLLPLNDGLAQYPLFDPSSVLRKNVKTIASLIDDYNSARLYRYVDLSNQVPTICYASEGLRLIAEHRALDFMTFMANAFKILFGKEPVGNPDFRKNLLDNPDFYSPYRELAPSRCNMRRDNAPSPFSPPHLRTDIGVFSALVSRGITFGTVFARYGPTVFTSPSDFNLAVSRIDDIKLYCDRKAYGSDNPRRKPDLAVVYWERLSKEPWRGISATDKVPFKEAYEYFHPPVGHVRFPQIGELTAYLLTADYVYAGLVEEPSVEYLSKVIFDLNKEPARVLEYLGFVDKRPDERLTGTAKTKLLDQYKLGLESAFRLVKNSIPLDYHEFAGLDLIVTEHSLCKFGRSNKLCNLSV